MLWKIKQAFSVFVEYIGSFGWTQIIKKVVIKFYSIAMQKGQHMTRSCSPMKAFKCDMDYDETCSKNVTSGHKTSLILCKG